MLSSTLWSLFQALWRGAILSVILFFVGCVVFADTLDLSRPKETNAKLMKAFLIVLVVIESLAFLFGVPDLLRAIFFR
jgi:uncharacterized membrane protein